jgi:hypothetical protein
MQDGQPGWHNVIDAAWAARCELLDPARAASQDLLDPAGQPGATRWILRGQTASSCSIRAGSRKLLGPAGAAWRRMRRWLRATPRLRRCE